MAGGGGINASTNMWALLSDNDPSHSEVAAVKQRLDGGMAKDKGHAAEDRRQAVASGERESSGVGGNAARHDREDKQARKERNKKQKKPHAAASGEASTVLTIGEPQNPTSCIHILLFFTHTLLFFAHVLTYNSRHYLFWKDNN